MGGGGRRRPRDCHTPSLPWEPMAFPLPTSLSPSKVSSFKECALAFRLSTIDRLPEPPSPWAAKGTLVHRALELLFWEEPVGRRTLDAALAKLERARAEVLGSGEYGELGLDAEQEAEFVADAETLVRNYFALEDPDQVDRRGREGEAVEDGPTRFVEADEPGQVVPEDLDRLVIGQVLADGVVGHGHESLPTQEAEGQGFFRL